MTGRKRLYRGFLFTVLAVFAALAACKNPWIIAIAGEEQARQEPPAAAPAAPDTPAVPVLTGTVSITGTPEAGQTLTADISALNGTGAAGYQWGLGDALSGPFTDIAAATAPDYTVQTGDDGKYIIVTVTRAGYSGSVSSDPGLGPVGLPLLTGTVTASGTAEVGQTLTADTTSLGGTGAISYQWQGGDAPAGPFTSIASATADMYILAAADDGKYIVVMVTRADNSGFAVSGALGPVAYPIAVWIADAIAAAVAEDLLAGSDANHAISLPPLDIELDSSGWTDLLDAIGTADKFVTLDLTDCTGGTHSAGGGLYSDGTFDPDYTITSTGKGKIVSLVLPDAATSLAAATVSSNSAFKNFGALKSVSGANVAGIGRYAFSSRTGLTSVNLPAAQTIDSNAFAYCTGLTSVSLPAAQTIGTYAFTGCTGLISVSLPTVQTLNRGAFASCAGLTSVSLPASLSNIVNNPFVRCTNLSAITIDSGNAVYKHSDNHKMILNKAGTTLIAYPSAAGSVTLNDGITGIGDYAFSDNTGLTSVDFPAVVTIGASAFSQCTGLTSVSFLAAQTIGDYAFYNCRMTELSLPAAETIGSYAFQSCTSLTEVNLPAAETINSWAFEFCTALTEVNLPAAETIGSYAFRNCTALTTVTIGSDCDASSTASFPNGFKGYYDDNGKLDGVYTWNGAAWSYAP